jgi:hypothetical protein
LLHSAHTANPDDCNHSCCVCDHGLTTTTTTTITLVDNISSGAKMNLNKYSCAVLAGMRDNHQRRANLEV